MSLSDDILNGLVGTATYKVDVGRSEYAGRDMINVEVYRADGRDPHVFEFATDNKMSGSDMATVIRSVLNNVDELGE